MQKLTDFINPQFTRQKLYELRDLKNSFQRNMIQPSSSLRNSHAQSQYQSKLSNHNFRCSDLFLLFTHLYNKEQMSVSDRNLIRKILLTIFTQQMMIVAGKNIVYYAQFQKLQHDQTICLPNRFYLLLKGSLQLKSQNYNKNFQSGDYFGHFQLLSQTQNNHPQIYTKTQCFILCIKEKDFRHNFQSYFQKKNKHKIQSFPTTLKNQLQPINFQLILEQMQEVKFKMGEKIVKKDEPIKYLYFLYEGQISQYYDKNIEVYTKLKITSKCVGLAQYLLEQNNFCQDMFLLENSKGYRISISNFEKYVGQSVIKSLQRQINNLSYISNTYKKQIINPQSLKSKNFMRIRKVKLSLPKKLKTTPSETLQHSQMSQNSMLNYQADFMFVKKSQICRYSNKRKNKMQSSLLYQKSLRNSQIDIISLQSDF